MPKPVTFQLLEAVRACVRQIRRTDGYHTNAGAAVTLEPGQAQDTSDADRPDYLVDVIWLGSAPADDRALKDRAETMVVGVAVKMPADSNKEALRVHEIVADVRRAMSDQQARFPLGTDFPKYAGTELITPTQGLAWVGAVVRYTANVRN